MRSTVEVEGTLRREPAQRTGPRRAKMVVRRIDAWSVLKLSLLFYFCVMLIAMFALVIGYWILGVVGVLDSISELLTSAGFGSQQTGFQINGYWIFTRLFVTGLVGVVVWSIINMFLALLYNLVSDVVGGIGITLQERR
jgi:hypothetical protein